jgi:hypothetical protein
VTGGATDSLRLQPCLSEMWKAASKDVLKAVFLCHTM